MKIDIRLFGFLLLIGGWLIVYSIDHFEITFMPSIVFWILVIPIPIVGILYVAFTDRAVEREKLSKWQMMFLILISFFSSGIFFSGFISGPFFFANEKLSDQNVNDVTLPITKTGLSYGNYVRYNKAYVKLEHDGNYVKIYMDEDLIHDIERSESVTIQLKKGFFGYVLRVELYIKFKVDDSPALARISQQSLGCLGRVTDITRAYSPFFQGNRLLGTNRIV